MVLKTPYNLINGLQGGEELTGLQIHGTKSGSGKLTNSIFIPYSSNNMESHLQFNANGQIFNSGKRASSW